MIKDEMKITPAFHDDSDNHDVDDNDKRWGTAPTVEFDECGTNSGSYCNSEPNNDGGKILSAKETNQVNQVKVLFFMVLLVSILGAFFVYFYMNRLENDQFEHTFYYDAQKVMGSMGSLIEQALGGFDSLAATIVDFARTSNQTFPFVVINNLAFHSMKTLPMTGAMGLGVSPVITFDKRREWEAFAAGNTSRIKSYVETTLRLQDKWEHFYGPMPQNYTYETRDTIYSDFGDVPYNVERKDRLDFHLPEFHKFPLIMSANYAPVNWDWNSIINPEGITNMMTHRKPVISQPMMIPSPDSAEELQVADMWCAYYEDFIPPEEDCNEPVGQWYFPIIDNIDQPAPAKSENYTATYDVKAVIVAEFYWRVFIRNILPATSKGLIVVFSNTCTEKKFTYQIDGPMTSFKGVGDFHNAKYDGMARSSSVLDLNSHRADESEYTGLPLDSDACTFTFHLYPSKEMEDHFKTSSGIIFAISAVILIVFPFVVFLIYDRKVTQQRKKIVSTATRSEAIISSLFPADVRDELYPTEQHNGQKGASKLNGPPIAKLYPDTTVLFADIAEFTVWASVRDPFQVFTLLESIYGSFDKVAQRRKIFKVETVGDSYIAVAGLPDPRFDHAVAMVKFAKDIINEMEQKAVELEILLGPGTSSLRIRVGLNSGPTTAGVLRGAKGRFQIFGDTVNTAARMESNSLPGRIMCTEKTAELLVAAGKQHWVTARNELVVAKGKGLMQCYWCDPVVLAESKNSDVSSIIANKQSNDEALSFQRLVDWMSEMFEQMLREVVSNHAASTEDAQIDAIPSSSSFKFPRDEVTEVISLPNRNLQIKNHIKLNPSVKAQLNEYIALIASLYKKNPFHNFEHACHVVMAARKLLSRVVTSEESSVSVTAYGIGSDPLTQFAIVFSALIHDVDHPGVSNCQLVKEEAPVAITYGNKSVAEQNSVTLAWDLLLEPRFSDLRLSIMPSDFAFKHFRQLVVNAVLATDLFDMDLKELRESRWIKAFDGEPILQPEGSIALENEDSNRRATIVIEHIIQAADVSHTMQHWHIYQKWNRDLLREMYRAYLSGRAEKDPSVGWYDGELWFFDNYVIPLARKLKTCGVFGVSCDELLDYALRNRAEWAAKGRGIVAETTEWLQSDAFLRLEESSTSSLVPSTFNRNLVSNAFTIIVADHSYKVF